MPAHAGLGPLGRAQKGLFGAPRLRAPTAKCTLDFLYEPSFSVVFPAPGPAQIGLK